MGTGAYLIKSLWVFPQGLLIFKDSPCHSRESGNPPLGTLDSCFRRGDENLPPINLPPIWEERKTLPGRQGSGTSPCLDFLAHISQMSPVGVS